MSMWPISILNLGAQFVVCQQIPRDSTRQKKVWEGVLGRSEKWWGDGCCRTSGNLRLLKPKLEEKNNSQQPALASAKLISSQIKMTQLCFVFLISPSPSIFWGLTFFFGEMPLIESSRCVFWLKYVAILLPPWITAEAWLLWATLESCTRTDCSHSWTLNNHPLRQVLVIFCDVSSGSSDSFSLWTLKFLLVLSIVQIGTGG